MGNKIWSIFFAQYARLHRGYETNEKPHRKDVVLLVGSFILKLNFFYFFSFHEVHGFLLSLISDVYQIKLLREMMN